ncbi:MAG TPA: aminodeoxychorismate lyase [Mycobacteriales bacterium]|nr:aminodeoxychorismate lyase [Mycobacteriales bacterium]
MADRVLGVLGTGPVDPDTPLLRVDDLGVLRGDGCFETLRVHDGVIEALDAHLARLRHSAAGLDLPAPQESRWRALIDEVVAAWAQPGEAVLRLVLTRGVEGTGVPTGFATVSPLPDGIVRQRRDGVSVITLDRGMPADAHRGTPWLLGGVKSLSYAVNMAALRHARRVGADDVIFVSGDGQVTEGPTSTVVWARSECLCTTPVSLGILAGTTVGTLFARAGAHGFATRVAGATVDDLHAADEIWLVSSLRAAVRVSRLDGRERADAGLTARVHAALGLTAPGRWVPGRG